MLCSLTLATVTPLAACSDGKGITGAGRSIVSSSEIAAPDVSSDSLQVIHGCGNVFYIRSAHDTSVTVKWQTWATYPDKDSALVTLPARASGTLFSSTMITSGIAFSMAIAIIPSTGAWGAFKQGTPPACLSVPATVPDSIPAFLSQDSVIVSDQSKYPLKFSKNVVLVAFTNSATTAQRNAAITSISGAVIGGVPFRASPGYYIVAIPPDASNENVFTAVQHLKTLPGVRNAMPNAMIDNPGAWSKPQ